MYNNVFLEEHSDIQNFIQVMYLSLSSNGSVPLRSLEELYLRMKPTIHENASLSAIDCKALRYAAMRLPSCISKVRHVILGQSESLLEESGIPTTAWTEVFARARRRRNLYNGSDTMICFIASKSDIDDIIPALLAYQIEWNKAHRLLAFKTIPEVFPQGVEQRLALLSELLNVDQEDAQRLLLVFEDSLPHILVAIKAAPFDLYIRSFEASYCRYRRETEAWWRSIQQACPGIEDRPVYFVSSNTHSLINLLSGYAETQRQTIVNWARTQPDLAWLVSTTDAQGKTELEKRENLLYYLLMKYEAADPTGSRRALRLKHEESVGIRRVVAEKTLDIPTQCIDLQQLLASKDKTAPQGSLARLMERIWASNAMILNIDYPLGRTAYFILSKLAEHLERIKGVYVIGKAASLFADRGDIIIPSSVLDQHTRNNFFFENCIKVSHVEPYIDTKVHGIYDNQKAVTVLGTFLQNRNMLDAFLAAGITDLEMEAGPYLVAMYEMTRPKRYPEFETVFLQKFNTDLGIVHYISDNPLAGRHLDTNLDTDGIDATYAVTRAVLDRILTREFSDLDGEV